jgi:hypothetical protein
VFQGTGNYKIIYIKKIELLGIKITVTKVYKLIGWLSHGIMVPD